MFAVFFTSVLRWQVNENYTSVYTANQRNRHSFVTPNALPDCDFADVIFFRHVHQPVFQRDFAGTGAVSGLVVFHNITLSGNRKARC